MDNHNLLHSHQPEGTAHRLPPAPKKARRSWRWMVLGVVFLLMIAIVVYFGIAIGRITDAALDAQTSFEDAQDSAIELEFSRTLHDLELAEASFEQAQSGITMLSPLHVFPWVGSQLDAVSILVDAGIDAVGALQEAVSILQDIEDVAADAQAILEENNVYEDVTFETMPEESRVALLRSLATASDEMKQARVKLLLAQQDLDRLQTIDVHPGLQDVADEFASVIPGLVDGLDLMIPIASALPELVGVDQDRQWLLLFLNNMEMRPAGGFIGNYGLLLVRNAEVKNLEVADSYEVDVLVAGADDYILPPPTPLGQYVGVDKWYFRDANWSPDFATAARDAVQLMRQQYGYAGQPVPEIHGVLGFTPDVASHILELTGPVTVDGIEFTADNLAMTLEYDVEYGFVDRGVAWEDRKKIVGTLAHAVMDALMDLPVTDVVRIFTIAQQSLNEKEIAFYSYDEETQAIFESEGWAGRTIAQEDDVLLVVDANLAALKSDPAVDRHITYTIEPNAQGYQATTSITYTHTGDFDLFTTRYRTYTRVYAPLGSTLITHQGSLLNDKLYNPSLLPGEVTVADDLGMTSFGAFTSIEPGEERTLSFTYQLPDSVVQAIQGGVYQLQVMKQLGAANHALTLDMDFGKNITAAAPAEIEQYWGDTRYTTEDVLNGQKVYSVQF